ncbi:MAG: sel1 repeat family protein [Pseudomonadota bacterium]
MARYDIHTDTVAEMGGTVNAEVLFQMGILASTGRNGEANNVEAHKWFNLAALKGKEEAADYRAEITSEMSADEVRMALKSAREWLKLH